MAVHCYNDSTINIVVAVTITIILRASMAYGTFVAFVGYCVYSDAVLAVEELYRGV